MSDHSLDSLVAEHYRFVWRILRGLGLSAPDAEDTAQQVFMIAARKIDSIAPGKARSFLYGTTLRTARNARRSLQRRREVPDEQLDASESMAESPERTAELARARELASELLAELPEKLRRVLLLAEVEQLEIAEIAALEGVPVGTAASRLRLGREQFRKLLSRARDKNPFVGSA
jgi:RNA polymerase sigma-70 factor (ECF subfamily)